MASSHIPEQNHNVLRNLIKLLQGLLDFNTESHRDDHTAQSLPESDVLEQLSKAFHEAQEPGVVMEQNNVRLKHYATDGHLR